MAHIEREIKLELTREALARLGPLAPMRRSLSSVYYDTPREDLRRAGVALRLRRDRGRWLQTLKADAVHGGLSARTEWELPVRCKALEPEAFPADEIRASTGIDLARLATRLRPVFETRFVRRSGVVQVDGKANAEIAIDRGAIVAGRRQEPIREVELELVSGDTDAMLRFAEGLALPLAYESKAERGYRLAAGQRAAPRKWGMPPVAPEASPGEAFAAVFAACLMQAGTNASGLLRSHDAEYLHQLRVGLRRLRSALRAFAPLLHGERPVKRALRRLTPLLGAARDADVLVSTLQSLGAAPAVLRAARAYRARMRRTARDLVRSHEFRQFLFRGMRWLQREPWSKAQMTLAAFAPQRLEKLHGKTLRGVDLRRAKRRHALRIRIKRLRYSCDFFVPCFPSEAAQRYAEALRGLQDLLGDLNDLAVARRLLAGLKAAPPPALARRESALIAKLEAAWASFAARTPYWRRPA
jgi:inorganic triphosphatase YgiF